MQTSKQLTDFRYTFTVAYYRERRDGALAYARRNMACLMNDFGYARDSKVVLEANGNWVRKAKRFHRVAMRREPIMEMKVNNYGDVRQGLIFAVEA